jgi:hypothetical protein
MRPEVMTPVQLAVAVADIPACDVVGRMRTRLIEPPISTYERIGIGLGGPLRAKAR